MKASQKDFLQARNLREVLKSTYGVGDVDLIAQLLADAREEGRLEAIAACQKVAEKFQAEHFSSWKERYGVLGCIAAIEKLE